MLRFIMDNINLQNGMYDSYSYNMICPQLIDKKVVALMTNEGKYIGICNNNEVVSNKEYISPKEIFYLIKVNYNKVVILSYNNKFLTPNKKKQYKIFADKEVIGNWQVFTVFYIDKDNIVLRSYNGNYVGIYDDENRSLGCNKEILNSSHIIKIINLT